MPPTAAPPPWGVAAPTSSGPGAGSAVGGAIKGRLRGAIGGVIVLIVIASGIFIYQKVANPDHLGQVIFSTDTQSSINNCKVYHQVTSVKVGTPVYSVYFWTHRLSANQSVHEEDFKDGVSLGTWDIPSKKSSGIDCLAVTTDLTTDFDSAGVYEIKLTVGTEVVAEGKLTITK